MAQTIGQLLKNEREKRGFSIADVAHDTHIHADTLRGLEADDYSVFSSTTYARSFMLLYSRHLEVDADKALHDFDSVSENLISGKFSYLKSVTDSIEPGETIHPHEDSSHIVPYGDDRKQPFPLVLAVIVFLLLLIIPVFYLIGKKADSMEEATSIFKAAISSKKETLINNQAQQNAKEIKSTDESIASNDPDLPISPPPLPEDNIRKHRFPRPLPASKSTPASSTSQSNLPLKAIPVNPKSSLSQKKTTTAQNRN